MTPSNGCRLLTVPDDTRRGSSRLVECRLPPDQHPVSGHRWVAHRNYLSPVEKVVEPAPSLTELVRRSRTA